MTRPLVHADTFVTPSPWPHNKSWMVPSTRRGALWFLGGFFLLLYGAVVLRVDYFPLSWVPMYSHRVPTDELTVKYGDLAARRKGFRGVTADGREVWISATAVGSPGTELEFAL